MGAAFAFVQDSAFGVEGIAGKKRVGMADLFVAEIGDDGSGGQVVHGNAHDKPQGEQSIHEWTLEFGVGGEIRIDMQRLVVHGEAAEEDIIHFREGATEFMVDDFADDEIFVIFSTHGALPFTRDYHN